MKKIVIMGASSGIGLRVAEEFASRGVKVGLAARHTKPMADLKARYPDMVEYMSIDVTKPDAPSRLGSLISKLGGMDIYFHVAGIGYGNLNLARHGQPGPIAAVTSVAGTNGIGRLSAYSASKKCAQTYMVALEQLAHEEGAHIRFTDIRPGWVRTPLLLEGVKYPMEMTLDYAAPLIIKAIVKAPRVAVFVCRWNVVVGLWRQIPNALWTRLSIPVSTPDSKMPQPSGKPFPSVRKEKSESEEV